MPMVGAHVRSAVTAKLRPKEDSVGEDEPERAFQVSREDYPRLNDMDDLAKAIRQTNRSVSKTSMQGISTSTCTHKKLERGNASKTNRKSCVGTPLGKIATAFCRDGQLE
ncbi:SEC14, partial [Symbiodinium sp. KB8]